MTDVSGTAPPENGDSKGPLAGVKVLAIESYLAANVGSWLMTQFGAEVTKIEVPPFGDALRANGPHVRGPGGSRSVGEIRFMANKSSVGLDLDTPAGVDVLLRLAETADVVWTNLKPRSLVKRGVTYAALRARNPRIVYTTLSGFGHDDVMSSGPYGSWAAFDIIAQGLAGLQFRTEGREPGIPAYNGIPLGDNVTSLMAVLGTVLALRRADLTGEGDRVDIAMHDAMVWVNELAISLRSVSGKMAVPGRSGSSAPYGAFPTADGWVNIAIGGNSVWRKFCGVAGLGHLVEDPRFDEASNRVDNGPELDRIVAEWTASRTTDAVIEVLQTAGVPCAPVFDVDQVIASPQVAARDMLIPVDDDKVGVHRVPGNPVKLGSFAGRPAVSPRDFGADTAAVLAAAGFTPAEITGLAKDGVIAGPRRSSASARAPMNPTTNEPEHEDSGERR